MLRRVSRDYRQRQDGFRYCFASSDLDQKVSRFIGGLLYALAEACFSLCG